LSWGFRFVAEQWKKLPFAEKQRYEDLEEEDRRRYHAEMAVFNEALELGIVHELPGSGGDVKDAGSERHVKPKTAGSMKPAMPQWVSEKAAQVSDPPLVPSVGQVGGSLMHTQQPNSFQILLTYLHASMYDCVARPLPWGMSLPLALSGLAVESHLQGSVVPPQDGAVGDDNTFGAPGNTPWAETPTSRSCVANPER
jgi:hypothetical protein